MTQQQPWSPVQFSSLSTSGTRNKRVDREAKATHGKGKAAPSGIRVSGADSSRVPWSFQPPRANRPTAGTRRPSSEADSFGRGLVLWQRGPFGTGSQRARTGRRPGTSRLRIRQRRLLLCWRLRTLSLFPLRMLPSALDSDALELRPVVDVLLRLSASGALSFSTLGVCVRVRGQRSRSAQSQPSARRRVRVRHEQADRRQHGRHVERRLPCALRQRFWAVCGA